jgi:hypothetical protein
VNRVAKDINIKTVVFSYRNETYLNKKIYREGLINMIQVLLEADKKVLLVLQAPLPGAHIDKYLMHHLDSIRLAIPGLTISDWHKIYNAGPILKSELPKDVLVVNPEDYFCDADRCLVANNGKAYYFDDDHMSVAGATIVAEMLLKKMSLGLD